MGDNMLNDEDLAKICQRLRAQPQNNFSIARLRLHSNEFREPSSFIDLIAECGNHFTHLDFSKMTFTNPQAI